MKTIIDDLNFLIEKLDQEACYTTEHFRKTTVLNVLNEVQKMKEALLRNEVFTESKIEFIRKLLVRVQEEEKRQNDNE